MRRIALSLALSLCSLPALAAMQVKPLDWTIGGERFSGFLVYDDAGGDKRPGLVMVPNWMGVSDLAVERAKEIAGDDYVVLVAAVYGVGVRPKDAKEAGAAARGAYADGGKTLRARANEAVRVLKAQAGSAPLDAAKIGALGFCFGGSVVLDMARAGKDLKGVAALHAGLPPSGPRGAP